MSLIVDSAGTRAHTPVHLDPPAKQDPANPDPQPSSDGKPASGDAASANTQKQIAEAQAAERAVADLAKASGKNGESPETAKMLKERKEFAAKQWAEVKQAIEYELRLAAGGDPKKLAERQQQVKGYDAGNPEYQKMVDEAAKRIQAQSPAERNTDIQRYELAQAKLAKDENGVKLQQKELDEAINKEIDERLSKLGSAVNYIPEPYRHATDPMIERYSGDPEMQDMIRAAVIARRMDDWKGLGAGEQVKQLENLLKGASPELTKAVYANPKVDALLRDSVAQTYAKEGPMAAARQLRELTEAASPQLAGRILAASQPTIEKIASDMKLAAEYSFSPGLQERKPTAQQILNDMEANFGRIYDDLSVATSRAAQDPANAGTVQNVANALGGPLARHGARYLNAAAANTIAAGNGADLTLALVKHYKQAGDINSASYLAGQVRLGLQEMQKSIANGVKEYEKAREEMSYLLSSYGATGKSAAQQKKVDEFWKQYQADHPELAKTQAEIDRLAKAYIDTTGAIDRNKALFDGLYTGDKVLEANNKLLTDTNSFKMLGASQKGQEILAQMVASGEGGHPVITQLSPWNLPREGRTLLFRIGVLATMNHMKAAGEAIEARDFGAARQAIEAMRGNSKLLGYSGERQQAFNKMLDKFDEMAVAAQANDTKRLAQLADDYAKLVKDPRNGPSFNPSTPQGMFMRALGVGLTVPILGSQWEAFFGPNADFGSQAQTILNTVITGQQTAFMTAGAARMAGIEGAAKYITYVSKTAEVLATAAALVELGVGVNYLLPGEHQDAIAGGLHIANAAGNAAVAAGYMAANGWFALPFGMAPATLTGVGTVVVAVTSIGIFVYGQIDHAREASKFETETTTKYLEALGLDKDVADQFRNQDSDGRSPGPVLVELGKRFGLDASKPEDNAKLIDYLNRLGKDRVAAFVEQAHGVDPNDKGEYPKSDPKTDPYLALPIDPKSFLADPKASRGTTLSLNSEGRYEDSATQMVFDPKLKRWFYQGKIDTSNPYTPNPVYYDPVQGQLMMSDGNVRYITAKSMDGLENWLLAQGYGAPG